MPRSGRTKSVPTTLLVTLLVTLLLLLAPVEGLSINTLGRITPQTSPSSQSGRLLLPRLEDSAVLRRASRELGIAPPWNAPRWLWSFAWRMQTFLLKHALHRWDTCIKTDSFLNLSVLWWKAISGERRFDVTFDGRTAYDLLPNWTRALVSFPLCYLYPNLHHQNVALRTLFIDKSLREVTGNASNTIVVTLGAGFDTRSLRFLNAKDVTHSPDSLQMFEIDLPAVTAEKEQVLRDRYLARRPKSRLPGLKGADLNDAVALTAQLNDIFSNHAIVHPSTKVVFVVEAVLMYLKDDKVLPALTACVESCKRRQLNDVALVFSDRFPGVLESLDSTNVASVDAEEKRLVGDFLLKTGFTLDVWSPKPGRARHMGRATMTV